MRASTLVPSLRANAIACLALIAGALEMDAADPTPKPAEPDPIAVVRAHIEAFNRHDAAALAERVSPDFVYYNVASDATTVRRKVGTLSARA